MRDLLDLLLGEQHVHVNIETLEAYGVQQASDYPNTNFTEFYGIDLQNAVGRPELSWTAVNAVTDVGQSARVVSNANAGGEVDILLQRAGRCVGVHRDHQQRRSLGGLPPPHRR